MQEAARSLEAALEVRPGVEAAFNLVLCAFAGGDPDSTRRAYTFLLQVGCRSMNFWVFCVCNLPVHSTCATGVCGHPG